MIRLTWLQSRIHALTAGLVLIVLALVVAVTGPHLADIYHSMLAGCASQGDCSSLQGNFVTNDASLQLGLDVLMIVVPCLIGVFWGAPLLARELETGTFRLAWTQSVTRTKWLSYKLVTIGVVTILVTGLASLLVTWWSRTLDTAKATPFTYFEMRDVVPIGYAVFGLALGVVAGMLIRRTVPAMAATLCVFIAARLVFIEWVRPHLGAPVSRSFQLSMATVDGFGQQNTAPPQLFTNPPNMQNALLYSSRVVDRSGAPITQSAMKAACSSLYIGGPGPGSGGSIIGGKHAQPVPGPGNALQDCVSKLSPNYHVVATYLPPTHYWSLQWEVLACYLAASLVLGAFALLWLRKRV